MSKDAEAEICSPVVIMSSCLKKENYPVDTIMTKTCLFASHPTQDPIEDVPRTISPPLGLGFPVVSRNS